MNKQTPKARQIPPAQILVHVIEKAITAFDLIKDLEAQWKERFAKKEDASSIRKHQEIIIDVFTVYIASLVDKTKGTHSLLKSYETNVFIEQFNNNPLVLDCVEHRHKRAGHQSKYYGSVIKLDSILDSDIRTHLSGLRFVVRQFQEK
jgi:hypothetical protein